MKINLILICIAFILISCNGQEKRQDNDKIIQQNKNTEMTTETFDIKTFENNKIDGEYNFTLEDGTKVRQLGGKTDYSEYITPPKPKLFVLFKGYYKNGTLREYVTRYPKDFIKLIQKYDKEGALIESTNYDSLYKLTFDEVLIILEKEEGKGVVDIFDRLTTISRSSDEKGKYWHIQYYNRQKKGYDKRIEEFNPSINQALIIIEELTIDDVTSKIIKRGYYPHNNN